MLHCFYFMQNSRADLNQLQISNLLVIQFSNFGKAEIRGKLKLTKYKKLSLFYDTKIFQTNIMSSAKVFPIKINLFER